MPAPKSIRPVESAPEPVPQTPTAPDSLVEPPSVDRIDTLVSPPVADSPVPTETTPTTTGPKP